MHNIALKNPHDLRVRPVFRFTDWTDQDFYPNGLKPLMGLNPLMDPTQNGIIPEWNHSRMDPALKGLNPKCNQPQMDSTPTGLNSEWTENGPYSEWNSI